MRDLSCAGGVVGGPSMKVPPKRKGNFHLLDSVGQVLQPSMKVPPKRKGNPRFCSDEAIQEIPQ